MAQQVDVAVAVICHHQNYLLAYRDKHLHQGDRLEFVGGKVEIGETPIQALVREVAEEIGLDIANEDIVSMGHICHDYGDKQVCLWVYQVCLSDVCYDGFKRVLVGRQGQALYWYDKKTLLALGERLPKANGKILEWLAIDNES